MATFPAAQTTRKVVVREILGLLALGMACCTANRGADEPLQTAVSEEITQWDVVEEAIDAAKVDPCSSDLRFVERRVDEIGRGVWWVEVPSGSSMPLFMAFPSHHRRVERLVEYRNDRMINFLKGVPQSITLLEILHAEGECGSSVAAPRGSRPWVVEEELRE